MDLDEAIDLTLRRARTLDGLEAEVVAVEGDRLDVGVRLGKTEKLKRSRERRLALRLFAGQSSAVTSTADLSAASLAALVDDCVGLARATTPDPFSGLPDLDGEPPLPLDLDLLDPTAESFTAEQAIAIARDAEEAALAFDPRLSNSEGAEFSAGARRLVYATSRGFQGEQCSSSFSLTVVPVAVAGASIRATTGIPLAASAPAWTISRVGARPPIDAPTTKRGRLRLARCRSSSIRGGSVALAISHRRSPVRPSAACLSPRPARNGHRSRNAAHRRSAAGGRTRLAAVPNEGLPVRETSS
jgi:predicted Zn-dependent protease